MRRDERLAAADPPCGPADAVVAQGRVEADDDEIGLVGRIISGGNVAVVREFVAQGGRAEDEGPFGIGMMFVQIIERAVRGTEQVFGHCFDAEFR